MANNNSFSSESLSMLLSDVGKFPVLSREREEELATLASKGDKAARDELINSNLRFVVREALKFCGRGLELEDLVIEGSIGLGEAVDRFSVSRGVRFITYAVYRIDQAMRKAVREQGRAIRLPDDRCAELGRIFEAIDYVDGNVGVPEVRCKVAELAGVSEKDLLLLLGLADEGKSLNETIQTGDSFVELSERVCDERIESPEKAVELVALSNVVSNALKDLSERESKILSMRYGLSGGACMSLQKIGDVMGLSKERVRQLNEAASRKIRYGRYSSSLQDFLVA